jgi:hypothetical protein
MLKKILLIAVLATIGYFLFSLGSSISKADFKTKLDSLDKVNDSLVLENLRDDSAIIELRDLDLDLQYRLDHQKAKVITIEHWIDSSKAKVDSYTEHELITSFNNRYPSDTVTNPLPLAQPVLVSAAKDLVELDGTKEKLVIKDSVIALQESRITLKDSTINLFVSKEGRYKAIIGNKDQAIAEWSKQYNLVSLENKKLKVKSKFQRITTYIIVGGLTYTLLAK